MTALLSRPNWTSRSAGSVNRGCCAGPSTTCWTTAPTWPSHGTLPALSREALLASLDAVRLTGRGGAGFPLARKIRALAAGFRCWW